MLQPYERVILLFFLLDVSIWLVIKACGGGRPSASALNDSGLGVVRIIFIIIIRQDHLSWGMHDCYI